LKHDHIQLKDNLIELIKLQMDLDSKRVQQLRKQTANQLKEASELKSSLRVRIMVQSSN